MSVATLTSKGQVTIPKDVRDQLHLGVGGRVDFRVDVRSGTATLVPLNKGVDDVFGMLHHKAPATAVSVQEMRKGIAGYLRRKRT
jgi:antitoxin PrlF